MSALREVLAQFDVDTSAAASKLSGIGKTIASVTSTLGALGNAFIGSAIVHGMREFITGQIEAGSRVNDLSEKLGVGTEDLQQFQFAAGLAGVSGEEAAKGLQFLNKNIGEAIDGSKGAVETFAKLGITLKDGNGDVRETSDILPEVADAFQNMGSDAERTALAMKVFGKAGASMIPMLKNGSAGIEEMRLEYERLGGGMRQDFIKAADEAGDEIDKVKFAFNGWKSQIVFAILPAVTRFAKIMQTAIGVLRKVTQESRLAKVAWLAMGTAASIAGFRAATGFAKMLGVLPKDANIWKSLMGLGTIGLVIIAVLALVLVFEDLYTMLTGGESVIGDVIDGLFGVGATQEVVKEVQAIFSEFLTELEAFKPLAIELGKVFGEIWVAALPFIKIVAKSALKDVAMGLRAIIVLVRMFMSELGAGLQLFGGFADKAGDFAKSIGQDGIGDKLKSFGTAFAKTGAGISGASDKSVPASQIDGGERTRNIQHANDITINVTEAKDAKATGEAARRGVRQGLVESDNENTLAAVSTGS